MRISATYIVLLAVLCLATTTSAAPFQEVVKPQGLLVLGDFMQWVDLKYEYSGHDSDTAGSSSSVNTFKEKYHLFTNFAILDPHVLFLTLEGEVGLDQANTSKDVGRSQSSRNTQYQYLLGGSLFDQSRLPITFSSGRDQRTVVTQFSPTYTTDTYSNGITATLHNMFLPVKFRYWRTSIDFTGTTRDYTSTTNNLFLEADHNLAEISSSRLTITGGNQLQETKGLSSVNSKNYSIAVSNGLLLDRRKKYSLISSFSASESQAERESPTRSVHWAESIRAEFGKALRGDITYRYDYDKTQGFNAAAGQLFKYNELTGELTHSLFQSLDTSLKGRYRYGEILDGNETIYGGSTTLTYRKKLPNDSHLRLGFKGEYELTDRNLATGLFTVRDELHSGVQQGSSIHLNVSENLLQVISVMSRNPDITYVEGLDYTVNLPLGRVDIPLGGSIAPGMDLFISYSVRFNSNVKYTTDTLYADFDLSLFKNRFHIFGNGMSQDRNVISGVTDNNNLYNTRIATIHFDADYNPSIFSAEYSTNVSGPTSYHYWEGAWRFDYQIDRQFISLKARDRYLVYDATAAVKQAPWQNTTELGATYSRPVFGWASFSASVNYINTQGSDLDRQYLYCKTNLQGRFNKLFINLIGQSILRIGSLQTLRDDYVLVEVRRYF